MTIEDKVKGVLVKRVSSITECDICDRVEEVFCQVCHNDADKIIADLDAAAVKLISADELLSFLKAFEAITP